MRSLTLAGVELFYLKDADHRQMVADTTFIDGAQIGAMRFDIAVDRVGFSEEGEGEDACLQMGKGSGVGENMVDGGPLTLIFVGARLKFGCPIDEVMATGKKFELWGVGFSIEITYDEKIGVLPDSTNGIRVFLELLTNGHTQILCLSASSLRGKMKDIYIQSVTSRNRTCHMQNITCLLFLEVWTNRLFFNGMEGERGVE